MSQENRLERAVALHLQQQQRGGDWQELLRDHPDLADLLRGLRDEDAAGATAPAPDALPTIGGYRLEHELGRGGNGTVHAAIDQRLGRRVALKVLHDDLAGRPTTVARFLREAQLLARLDHPGIVKVLDVGEHGGRPWLAMEFVAGSSLATHLEQLKQAGGHTGDSLRRLVGAVAQVAEALAHAHAAGIVHRDVKPSNILLRDDAHAVLTDFGIARDELDPGLTQTGIVVGSPHYMAPEQSLGPSSAIDTRADVFALGATLYECITLTHAFDGANAQAVLHAVLHHEPADPRRRSRAVPADLVAIVQHALEKVPDHRYASAADFAADLRAFLDLREVSARTTTRLTRWWRRARRNPALGVTAALAAVLLTVLGWLGWQWPHLAAARAAERDRAYEAATAAGFAKRDDQVAQFRRAVALAPERPEAIVGLVMSVRDASGPAAALETLTQHAGATDDPALLRCRAWLLRRLDRRAEAEAIEATLPPPRTWIDLWIRALQLLASPPTPQAVRAEALATISLAVRTAPRANMPLQIAWSTVAMMTGDKEKRLEAAEALLARWSESPIALYVAGEGLMSYDARRAIGILQQAVDRGVDEPRCLVSLGFAHAIAGEHDRCIEVLQKAFVQPRLTAEPRASVLLMLDQLKATAIADRLALEWAEQAPDTAEARRFAGRAALRAGDAELALDHLDHAVRLRPQDVEIRLDRAVVHSQRNDHERQLAELDELVATHPTEVRVHRARVDSLAKDSLRPQLLAELRRWTTAKPDDGAGWRQLAEQLLATGDAALLEEALSAAERADYAAKGEDAKSLTLRATAHERLGQPAEAARLRARATALSPGK